MVGCEGDVCWWVEVFCGEDEGEGEGGQGVDWGGDAPAFWDGEGAVLKELAF